MPLSQQQTQQPNQGATQQNPQPTLNWWNWFTNNGANWAIVGLTFVLAVIGGFQWWATHTANKHNTVIERAYVTMSHTRFEIESADRPPVNVLTTIKVANKGGTPAKITHMKFVVSVSNQPLPDRPDYGAGSIMGPTEAFLVAHTQPEVGEKA